MKNESVKKSLEKSKNVLEEKPKMVKPKICIKKTNTFTIVAMNFVQEQLIKPLRVVKRYFSNTRLQVLKRQRSNKIQILRTSLDNHNLPITTKTALHTMLSLAAYKRQWKLLRSPRYASQNVKLIRQRPHKERKTRLK